MNSEDFVFTELGHYGYQAGEDDPQPLPFSVNGVSGAGRGVLVEDNHLSEFAERYRSNIFNSQFRYATGDAAEIADLGSRHQLPLLGDYYVVFNANSSAEIVHAINQAIDLVERLKHNYDVPYDAVTVFYTNRNIEVNVDYTVFNIAPTPRLDEIFLHMTCAILGVDPNQRERSAAFSQIDLGAYSYDRLTHVAGAAIVADKREIYKIRMSYAAFKKMSYQRLHEFSLRRPDLPPRERWPEASPKAADFYRSIKTSLDRDKRSDERDRLTQIISGGFNEQRAESITLKQLGPALMRRLFDEKRRVLPTHSPHFNKALGGGLAPGQFYIVAGAPGSGTSTLALQLLNFTAENDGTACLFISLQRGVEEVFKRSLSQLGQISASEIDRKRRNPTEMQEDKDFSKRIFNTYERYQQFAENITIIEGAAASNFGWLKQLVRDKKEQLAATNRNAGILLIIDSLQLMAAMMRSAAADFTGSPEERTSATDVLDLTARVKALCRELDITVLATYEHYPHHRGLSNDIAVADPAQRCLLDVAQFADTLLQLLRQNGSLLNLRDYFVTRFKGTPQESQLPSIIGGITRAEQDYLNKSETNRLRSEFIVADIIKNRSGGTEKVLFVYNRPVSTFEPVEYLSKD
jgi:replicative DNA helicase